MKVSQQITLHGIIKQYSKKKKQQKTKTKKKTHKRTREKAIFCGVEMNLFFFNLTFGVSHYNDRIGLLLACAIPVTPMGWTLTPILILLKAREISVRVV